MAHILNYATATEPLPKYTSKAGDAPARALTKEISGSSSLETLDRLLRLNNEPLNAKHICAAFCRSVALATARNDDRVLHSIVEQLISRLAYIIDTAGGRELSGILWAVAKLKVPVSTATLDLACNAFLLRSSHASPRDWAMILWAAAQLCQGPQNAWLSALFADLQPRLSHFPVRDLCIALYSLAKLRATALPCFQEQLKGLTRKAVRSSNCQDVANVIWALCWFKVRLDPVLMQDLVQHTYRQLEYFSAEELAAVIVVAAKQRWRLPPKWLRTFYGQVYWTCNQFREGMLVTVLWSLVAVDSHVPLDFTDRVLGYLYASKEGLTANDIAMLLVACAKGRFELSPDVVHGLLARYTSVMQVASAQSALMILWGIAKNDANCPDAQLAGFVESFFSYIDMYRTSDMVSGLCAISRLGAQVTGGQMSVFLTQSVAGIDKLSAKELCLAFHRILVLGHQPSRAWLQVYARAVVSKLSTFGEGELVMLVRAGWMCNRHLSARFWQLVEGQLELVSPCTQPPVPASIKYARQLQDRSQTYLLTSLPTNKAKD